MPDDHAPANDLKRSDLARLTGCNLETIRYYEGVGLMPDLRLKIPARIDQSGKNKLAANIALREEALVHNDLRLKTASE